MEDLRGDREGTRSCACQAKFTLEGSKAAVRLLNGPQRIKNGNLANLRPQISAARHGFKHGSQIRLIFRAPKRVS